MTLSSRVRLAEAEGTAIRARDDGWMLDELKEDVGRIIPGMCSRGLRMRILAERAANCKARVSRHLLRRDGRVRSNELKARLSRGFGRYCIRHGPIAIARRRSDYYRRSW